MSLKSASNLIDSFEKNKDITDLSWFKTKAKARFYFELEKEDDLKIIPIAFRYSKDNNLKFLILWDWTNCLFAFEEFDWIIMRNSLKWHEIKWHEINLSEITIKSWEKISEISEILMKNNSIETLYPWIWLPWTVWWAVFWNAWCFGLRIEDVFLRAKIMNIESWEIFEVNKEFMDFTYRNSILKKENKYFLIDATLDISNKSHSTSLSEILEFRTNKQPKWNSCWSFFMNPPWQSAGRFIDQAWLKWTKIWGAYISELHANFLMNDWGSFKDILEVASICKKEVKNKFGLDLVEEVNIIS